MPAGPPREASRATPPPASSDPHAVQQPARSGHGDGQRAGELDGHRDPERQVVQRLVEAPVHAGQGQAVGDHQSESGRLRPRSDGRATASSTSAVSSTRRNATPPGPAEAKSRSANAEPNCTEQTPARRSTCGGRHRLGHAASRRARDGTPRRASRPSRPGACRRRPPPVSGAHGTITCHAPHPPRPPCSPPSSRSRSVARARAAGAAAPTASSAAPRQRLGAATRSSRARATAATTSRPTVSPWATPRPPSTSRGTRHGPRPRHRAAVPLRPRPAAQPQVASVRVDGHRARFAQPEAQVQELVITPAPCAGTGTTLHRRRPLRRHGQARHRPRRLAGRLHPHRRRRLRGQRAAGLAQLVPGQRHPAGQGDLPGLDHRAEGRSRPSRTAGCSASPRHRTTSTWRWRLDQPVSSYLVTATIGRFDVRTGRTPGGVPYFLAVDPTRELKAAPVLKQLPAIIDYFSRVYGRYPFGQAGAVVDHARKVGYALETATRPVFDRAPGHPDPVPRARPPVVRRRRHPAPVEGHLAQRGLRRVLVLAVGRARRRRDAAPAPGRPAGQPGVRHRRVERRRPGTRVGARASSPPRSTTAAPAPCGPAREARRPGLLPDPARLAAPAPPTATPPSGSSPPTPRGVAHRDLTPFFQNWLYRRASPPSDVRPGCTAAPAGQSGRATPVGAVPGASVQWSACPSSRCSRAWSRCCRASASRSSTSAAS